MSHGYENVDSTSFQFPRFFTNSLDLVVNLDTFGTGNLLRHTAPKSKSEIEGLSGLISEWQKKIGGYQSFWGDVADDSDSAAFNFDGDGR